MNEVAGRINPGMRETIATSLVKVSGGYDLLFQLAKQRDPDAPLPYEDVFLSADTSNFSPELKKAVVERIEQHLIPRYIASNRKRLLRERENEVFKAAWGYGEPKVLGLVDLYNQIGVDDYDWRVFGPEPETIQWHYFSFDPKEKLPWDSPKPRYREVSFPEGMELWYEPSFDAEGKGWSRGLQPFGAKNGELVAGLRGSSQTFCRSHTPMETLWENEVLLLRTRLAFSEMKDGHRYRILVGGMSFVGGGDGYKIYLNGKPFAERERGVGRREGAKPIFQHIDKSWWPELSGQEVDIAVIAFMGIHKGVKSRHMSIWAQEMKLPDISDEAMIRSAAVLPMTSTAWQALQDLDDNDLDPELGRYLWDGKFTSNPAVVGEWKSIGITPDPNSFDPEVQPSTRGMRMKQLELKPSGKTHELFLIYSGDILMNLESNQALKMEFKTFDGTDYLFVEQGGYHTKHGMDWRPNWEVLTRQ